MTDSNTQKDLQLSIPVLLMEVFGSLVALFAGYEMYQLSEKGTGFLSELISWPHYPWVILTCGILLMVPFHRQLFRALKIAKQQKKEAEKANRPQF